MIALFSSSESPAPPPADKEEEEVVAVAEGCDWLLLMLSLFSSKGMELMCLGPSDDWEVREAWRRVIDEKSSLLVSFPARRASVRAASSELLIVWFFGDQQKKKGDREKNKQNWTPSPRARTKTVCIIQEPSFLSSFPPPPLSSFLLPLYSLFPFLYFLFFFSLSPFFFFFSILLLFSIKKKIWRTVESSYE